MRHLSIATCVVGFFCAATLTNCSLLIDTNERQCKSDADCVASGLGNQCVDQVCTQKSTAAACPGSSCTSSDNVVPGDGKCSTDKQCTSSDTPRCFDSTCVSSDVADRWVCTDGDNQSVRPATVRFTIHAVDFLSGKPPKNLVMLACHSNDVACAEPAGMFTDMDGTGHAQFDLPAPFMGFFEARSDELTTLLYLTRPLVKNTASRDLPILSASAVQITAGIANVPFDMTKGLAVLEMLDCSLNPAGGVQYTQNSAGANQFYLVNQVPSFDATETVYDSDNNTADGGFINLTPGYVTFTASLSDGGLQLGSFNAQIRANTVTFVDLDFRAPNSEAAP